MSNSNDNTNHDDNQRPSPGRPPVEWPTHQRPDPSHHAAQLARHQVSRAHNTPDHPHDANQFNDQQNTPEVGPDFDWQSYHSAWQQYYHRYFYQYYANWWQQQNQASPQATGEATKQESKEPEAEKSAAQAYREKIRHTVGTRAKKVSSSSHFKPILAGLSVGAAFLLLNYNQVLVGAIKQYVSPGNVVTTPVIVESNMDGKVDKAPKIIIPKIGVDAPVVYDEPKVDEASYQKALERGVVRLGNTANPGEKGNVVIGGHSSNNVFNAGAYKYVFVNLKRLDVGDVFYLNYNGQRYTYKVTTARKIITPKDISVLAPTSKPTVTLFTCDPPGTNVNRLIVRAEQVDPDPNAAKSSGAQPDVNKANPLPSVAPSLWDRLFGS